MSESMTNEWTELVEEWTAERPTVHADVLRARIERERRRMVSWVVADVGVTAFASLGAAYALVRFPSDLTRLLAWNVALIIVATWAFAIWNRRGIWRPLGETTESFIRLARLRCRRNLQAIRFATVLVVAQVVFVSAWRLWGPIAAPVARSEALVLVPVVVVAGYVIALSLWRRRVATEMAELDELSARLQR